ncbi:hypothetical protein D3C83_92630 [compost metagenome]
MVVTAIGFTRPLCRCGTAGGMVVQPSGTWLPAIAAAAVGGVYGTCVTSTFASERKIISMSRCGVVPVPEDA